MIILQKQVIKKNTSEQINILWRKLYYGDKLSSNVKEVSIFLPKNCKKKILLVELCLKMNLMSDFPTFF